jgi:hypothetical protein
MRPEPNVPEEVPKVRPLNKFQKRQIREMYMNFECTGREKKSEVIRVKRNYRKEALLLRDFSQLQCVKPKERNDLIQSMRG